MGDCSRSSGFMAEATGSRWTLTPQITTFKEVRNLLWLRFQVPHGITKLEKDVKRVCPHTVSLMETVRVHGQTLDPWRIASTLSGRWPNTGTNLRGWIRGVGSGDLPRHSTDPRTRYERLNVRWDHFASQFDRSRYIPTSEARDSRHYLKSYVRAERLKKRE